MIHFLKTWPEYFQAVWVGKKNFEYRLDDRNFAVDDILILCEFDEKAHPNGIFTGRFIAATIKYKLAIGLDCILSISVEARY